jgi:hypothetical protein
MEFIAFLRNGKKHEIKDLADIDFLPFDVRSDVLFVQTKIIEGAYVWNDEYKFWCIMENGCIKYFYSMFWGFWKEMPQAPRTASMTNLIPQQA